jgi:multidrug resistance efflux pump
MKSYTKYLLTGAIVALAAIVVLFKYWDYVTNPWTRDGRVSAKVIQVAARVSGPIVNIPIVDDQFVRAGDVLFEIDPRTYEASLEQARAALDQTGDGYGALSEQVEGARASVAAATAAVEAATHSVTQAQSSIAQLDAQIANNQAEFERQQGLLPERATTQKAVDQARANYEVSLERRVAAVAALEQAQAALREARANEAGAQASLAQAEANLGALGDANPRIRSARAALRQAELNLEFTRVVAPVDGYVTNLNLRVGSQIAAQQPALALVDTSTYRVVGYFRENHIGNIRAGDRAVVTLMSYPDRPLTGEVESLGWGIAQQDGSTGPDLLPSVSPTFEWIRLAQRIPVRVRLTEVPEGIDLRVGTTSSVLVETGGER